MADTKISALASATTPLAGTEVLPIVQSGTTVKATVENVVKATQPSSTANAIPYLNGSKIPTTGTALQFDGSTLSVSSDTQRAWSGRGRGINIGKAGGVYGDGLDAYWYAGIAQNSYYNGGWKYSYDMQAARYEMDGNSHRWFTAPSGIAGTAITFTKRLDLDGTSGDLTLNTGNLVIGTSGKGIDFSATSGTGTSELLSDYEEGTWTPTNPNISFTSASGTYTKVGRQVTVLATATWPTTADTNRPQITGLPFTIGTQKSYPSMYQSTATPITGVGYNAQTFIELYYYADTPVLRNNALSGVTVYIAMTYFI